MGRIALIGLPGSGKTSVGRLLSNTVHFDFIDLDERIVQRAGKSIPDIFSSQGESAFREMEATTLDGLVTECQNHNIVLSTGGGIILTEECRSLLERSWYTIYLKASVSTLVQRLTGEQDGRPLLHGDESLLDRITRLERERRDYYLQTKHITISVDDKTVAEVVQAILNSAPPIVFD